ncbi:MAG: iron ABC transporter permease [Actinomycetaceae bacterium]|nr:iron ABC transporter permease [Actinomycetaceae bacterium]
MTALARTLRGGAPLILLVIPLFVVSLTVGSGDVPLADIPGILSRGVADDPNSAIIFTMRFPRGIVAIVAGCAMGAAGALTQSLTRNPLAEPGTLGVGAGASLAIVLGLSLFPTMSVTLLLVCALIGAAISGGIVLSAGGVFSGRHTPIRLVLVGAAWAALTTGATSYFLLANPRAFEGFMAWHSGAVAPRSWHLIYLCAALIVVSTLILVPMTASIDALGLGEDMGRALGANPHLTWGLAGLVTILLASAATALVGPIAFVGLIAPLAVRWFTGPQSLPLTFCSGITGSLVLLAADTIGRVLLPPEEVSAGVVCGLIGAPIFVAIARKIRVVSL